MEAGFVIAIALALAFAATNGIHDASNAIATLVATRAARPLQAIVLASVFNLLGPLLVGAAVADTIGGIVTVDPSVAAAVIGSGLAGAVAWNLITWRVGIPSSSGHALIGGLVGAALAEGGTGAVLWGGLEGIHPVGVFGALIALAVSPPLGALGGLVVIRLIRRVWRRATRRWDRPVVAGEWAMSAALAFSHGANDAQKSVGVVAALLLADGRITSLAAPTWATVACAVALTAGTALGGWRIIRTVGRRIYRIQQVEGLASQSASSAIILGASLVGGPVATTQVVTSSIVGVGVGRRRLHHVRWLVVRQMALAWLVTIPAAAALAVVTFAVWQAVG
jgi:inorganic phosphate transporter, PiT family